MDEDYERYKYELNLRSAHTAHDRFFADSAQYFQSVLNAGDTALKASAILNGGAAVATLAFIGALLTSPTLRTGDYSDLVDILTLFGAGILVSTLATGATYLSQMFFTNSHNASVLTYEHPYVVDGKGAKREELVGRAFQVAAIALVVLSYVSFGVGAWRFRQLSSELLPSHELVSEAASVPTSRTKSNKISLDAAH